MRVAYFDCFSGISGSMALGALLHAGASLDTVSEALAALPTAGYLVESEQVEVMGTAALRLHLRARPEGVIRTYASIRTMLDDSSLPAPARHTAQRAIRLLAEADASVQSREPDLMTFHEAGDEDAVAFIVGAAVALHDLGIGRVFASPVPTGMGMTRTEHGIVPIPSPVVLHLLRGAPTYSRGIPVELVTPVGAAILAAIAEGYGDLPLMRSDAVGYGAGEPRPDFPHLLRVVVGTEERAAGEGPAGGDVLIEAHVDGADELALHAVIEAVIEAGARDAWFVPVTGPDRSAGAVVSALAARSREAAVVEAIRRVESGTVRTQWVRTVPDPTDPVT
jgi:uncharacterized protein (TIGR00299 family) protein